MNKQPLLMAHMIAGYPSVGESGMVAAALVEGGADIIELQIPFSDPMADGPTIAVACDEALKKGATVAGSLELLKKVAALGKPVAVMSYTNPVYRYGIPAFVQAIREAGANPLIIPDCPFDSEEGEFLYAETKKHGVNLIPVISPGVPRERLLALRPYASGFVYCTSRQGITGADSKFATDLAAYLDEIREIFKLPVGLGFGVKTRKDFLAAAKVADIVIAGSVFVQAVQEGRELGEHIARTARLLRKE